MTNRADQNWPEEMTYDVSSEYAIDDVCLLADRDGSDLGHHHSLGTVVESTERTVTALMTLVNEVMQ